LSCLKTLPRFGGAFYSYWAAVARWSAARITLRQGARVVIKSWTGEVMRTRSQRARSRWLRFNAVPVTRNSAAIPVRNNHHRIKLAMNVTIAIYFVLVLLFGALLPWLAMWLVS
jgi:hypothetical protein